MLTACATTGPAVPDDRLRLQAENAYFNTQDEALGLYQDLTASPQAQAVDWFRLGNLQAGRSELEAAAGSYREALRQDPGLAQARHNLGMTYLQLGVKSLLAARRELPDVDAEAAGSMRWLGCVMELFMGFPDPATCHASVEQGKDAWPIEAKASATQPAECL
jgi:tetratricopeptide (TPR) repeat protein